MDDDKDGVKTPEEERAELIEKLAAAEQAKENTVSELIELRKAKQEATEELERIRKEKEDKPVLDKTDPLEVVEQVLQRRDAEASKDALESAKSKFKAAHNEFADDSDPAGLLFAKFEKELGKFNLNGLKTEEDYTTRLKEAYRLASGTSAPEDKPEYYSGTRQPGSEIRSEGGATLTSVETKLIQELGMDKDKYLKMKAKRPAYVATLLQYRR